MNIESLKDRMQRACNDTEVEFRSSYSGRAMYGKACIGIVGSISDCNQVICDLVRDMMQEVFDAAIDASEEDHATAYDLNDELQNQVDELLSYRMDNMGMEVIMYWPQIEGWEEERRNDEEDEE